MDVEEIKTRVAHIDQIADDDEAAHANEVGLYQSVLAAIARGECADPAACAREALKTHDIGFARWFA